MTAVPARHAKCGFTDWKALFGPAVIARELVAFPQSIAIIESVNAPYGVGFNR